MTNAQVQTVSPQDFHQSNAKQNLVTIDLRTAAEVDSEYYSGCIDLPLQQLTAASLQQATACGEDTPIYLLCGSGMRAQKAAELLAGEIANPLFIISGGINALKAAGAPIEKGTGSVISLERQVRIAAGSLVLVGALIGTLITPLGYGLSAFVGAGLVFAGITDTCAMGLLIARMPWNNGPQCGQKNAGA